MYLQVKVYHQYQLIDTYLPSSSLILFLIFATGINNTKDTEGKIAAGINDTGGKFATSINDTSDKFCHQFH